ncbi:uncharacterized protein VICG_00820 [Vittaforma corneae ATCC 50505]|uniref:Uncharacterized protein n=1 Tax=Vittaforma corneae (strain ATCC 50505) TaxID=993615 RepID=L2GPF0_VITCO|nr:uncharacterized protein VICG_00820 [Vittaforma corneae ATCC 50505]ELA42177.1 hypothetical protein VICG_00820 [Vittaforma corneae ATCC 50505]
MIYFLAEYCLDSLNESFFKSVQEILNSNYAHVSYIPSICIYIALVGVNTLDISIVLSQILFLYNLFNKINIKFEKLIQTTLSSEKNTSISNSDAFRSIFDRDGLYRHVHSFISYVPVIPIIISMSLHIAYVSPTNKFRSLLGRILYSIVAHIGSSLFTNLIIRSVFEFVLSYFVMAFISKFYLLSKYKTASLILAFSGTYFFVKTYRKSEFFASFMTHQFVFGLDFYKLPEKNTILSYIGFFIIFMASFLFQRLIGLLFNFLIGKKKMR